MIYYNRLPCFVPPILGVDIETTSLDRFRCKVHAVGLSDGTTTWILTEGFERLNSIFADKSVVKIFHNFNYDGPVLAYQYGASFENVYDTLIAERILNNGFQLSNSLDDVLVRRFGILLNKEIRDLFIDYEGELTDEMFHYLEEDILYLPQLREVQLQAFKETNMQNICDLEMNLLLPVLDMTLTGIGFDLNLYEEELKKVNQVILNLETAFIETLGADFYIEVERTKKGEKYLENIPVENIKWSSWQQLKTVLHKIGVKVNSTSSKTLDSYRDKHPLVGLILDYKKWYKMLGWSWQEHLGPDNRIHPSWNQCGADSGRFSSSDPNMQQIPRPQENYPNFRALFRALPEHTLICADYSQQEPRILANVTRDERMIQAANEKDIYVAYARDIYHKEVEKDSEERYQTKQGVLAILYGVREKTLSANMSISVKEATDLRNSVIGTYPDATRWGNSQIKKIVLHGYSQSVLGRRRYFPEVASTSRSQLWKYDNISRNNPIQSTGADITKLALIKVYNILQEYDAHLIWTVHDEIGVSVHKDQAEELYPKVINAMVEAANEICPDVKFLAEGKITDIWGH